MNRPRVRDFVATLGQNVTCPRGQAMLEYSMLSWLLLAALMLGCTVRLIPGPRGQRNVIELFLSAYQTYYDSFHFLLDSPFP